uniref:peptide-methionine (S)-S-oxide reductase n=1 Tax=Coccolithus braarudii TaxID=221442 RepID=A0A7S0LVI2_9EUKA
MQKFWKGHDPTSTAWRRQYMNIIFAHSDEQMKAIKALVETYEQEQKGKTVKTEVQMRKPTDFVLAEDYHQKFYLRQKKDIFQSLGLKTGEEVIASSLAAKLNAFVAGHGTPEHFEEVMKGSGLEPKVVDMLEKKIVKRLRG